MLHGKGRSTGHFSTVPFQSASKSQGQLGAFKSRQRLSSLSFGFRSIAASASWLWISLGEPSLRPSSYLHFSFQVYQESREPLTGVSLDIILAAIASALRLCYRYGFRESVQEPQPRKSLQLSTKTQNSRVFLTDLMAQPTRGGCFSFLFSSFLWLKALTDPTSPPTSCSATAVVT